MRLNQFYKLLFVITFFVYGCTFSSKEAPYIRVNKSLEKVNQHFVYHYSEIEIIELSDKIVVQGSCIFYKGGAVITFYNPATNTIVVVIDKKLKK